MKVLITGGAGFIGSNLAHQLIMDGETVTILDNLSRRGTANNLAWLRANHGERFRLIQGDVRDGVAVAQAARDQQVIYHLAAQVAVTTSVTEPRHDFEVNALGTFNVLEAARRVSDNPILIFTSTNKVYGGMEDVAVAEQPTRYAFRDLPEGISESRPLDFHSPYGCSKGAADQYVRDYARIYGLRSVVFRMSCIYGTRQFGNEDQGWVAHFLISAALGRPISIYGDGKQVRDLLFVQDLIEAFKQATRQSDRTAGQVYNIGGGMANTLSVWGEFKEILRSLTGREIPVTYGEWRSGDQPVYVSDTTKAREDFGWSPQISLEEGIRRLWDWVCQNKDLVS
jgi:CDP-paratose 2-epimerase